MELSMSSSISSTQVAASNTPILVTTPSTEIKSFSDHKRDESSDDQRQPLSKQNKSYSRGNSNKNKQLTRSHAMKESASPPRTPNTNSHSPNDLKSHSPTAPPLSDEAAHLLSSQHLTAPTFVLPQSESNLSGGKSQLDIEFPKLTPPKTKVGWNSSSPTSGGGRNNRKSVSSDTSSNNNSVCEDTNESHDKNAPYQSQAQLKPGSQVNSTCTSALSPQSERKQQSFSFENDCEKSSIESYNPNDERVIISPSRSQCKSPNYSSGENTSNNNINNNMSSNNNGSLRSIGNHPMTMKGKPFLKNMGSSSSCEGGNTSSGFISRDSSSEQFLDQNGIDLVQFFKETLNKNAKDRNMLMKIERELLQLAVDQTGRTFIKFPPMSSYNRMLVHRTAAYFGMDHNVDSTQQSVIASTTKDTRIPEIRFKTLIRDTFSEEPRRSILKRETHSFEDYRQGGLLSVQRSILNRKARSFEEREEENEKEWQWIHDGGGGGGGGGDMTNKLKVPIRFTKIHHQSHSVDGYKSNYGSHGQLMRDDSLTSNKSSSGRLHKQDSVSTWRLSPSSSGYKTHSQRSDSVTPSPTGDGGEISSAHSPDGGRGVVWAVTDLASVPKGSLIIDPTTLQPILNQDGTLYHYDPSNIPTNFRYSNARKKADRHKIMNNNGKPNNSRESTNNDVTNNNNSSQDSDKSVIVNKNHIKSNMSINHNEVVDDDHNDTHDDEDDDEDDGEEGDTRNTENTVDDQLPSKNCDNNCKAKDDIFENKSSQCELKSHLNAGELISPKHKNQSTSPNLPLNEITINEEEESVTPTSCSQPVMEVVEPIIDSKHGKNEITSVTESPPVHEIRYQSNPYTNVAASATPTLPPVFSYTSTPTFSAPIETAGTIYHTGPDGTLYVLSQPVMYSYTTSTDNEVPSCWVPISFDQGARDPNLTVMPVATPYNGPTIYQSPVVYSEQFTNPPAIAGQVTQYPVGAYPMGYAHTYPVNGAPYQNIWPQPMTYFLPPSATPAPASVIVSPNAQNTQTQHATLIQSTPSNTQNASTNSITTGRRNSPSNNSGNNSTAIHSIAQAAAPIQTFSQSVPFSLATVPETTSAASGTAIYAIPPTVYPNMLQYPAPAATGYYQPLPHPQTNTTIISSVVPHSTTHHSSGTVPSTPHAYQTSAGGEVLTHFPFPQQHSNSGNNATPQSAPSTPLSLTTVPPNFKNPSLFATPPIIPTSSGSAMQTSTHVTNYGDKNSNNNNGGPKKMMSTPSYNSHSKSPGTNGNNHRQSSVGGYQSMNSHGGVKKNMNTDGVTSATNNSSHNEDTSSVSNMSSNYNPNNRMKNRDQMVVNSNYQQKSYKNQHQSNNNNYTPNSNSGSPNSNENTETTTHSGGGMQGGNSKYPTRGPSRIPPLDLKRNNSSANMIANHQTRSTPSTNSTESNNSPNSITSYDHSRSYYPSHQNPSHHQPSYGSSSIGGGHGHYYRGGSAGAVNSNIHHNTNHNGSDSAPNQTFFPFSVHSQSSGAPTTPLIDSCHPQALIGYNNSMTGMYVKFGQAFTFANPLPNNRKSPSNDMRAPLAPLQGYPTMMLPGGTRQMNPRAVQNNQNYKGNRTQHR